MCILTDELKHLEDLVDQKNGSRTDCKGTRNLFSEMEIDHSTSLRQL